MPTAVLDIFSREVFLSPVVPVELCLLIIDCWWEKYSTQLLQCSNTIFHYSPSVKSACLGGTEPSWPGLQGKRCGSWVATQEGNSVVVLWCAFQVWQLRTSELKANAIPAFWKKTKQNKNKTQTTKSIMRQVFMVCPMFLSVMKDSHFCLMDCNISLIQT